MPSAVRKPGFSMMTPVLDISLAITIITLSPGVLQYIQQHGAVQPSADQPPVSETEIQRLRTQYQELWRRYEELLLQLRQKPSPDQHPPGDIRQQEDARQKLNQLIEALREEIARLRRLLENSSSAEAEIQKRLEELRRLLEQLLQKIAEAETELKKLHYTKEQREKLNQLRQEVEALRRALKEAQDRQTQLDEEIARMEREQRKNAVAIKVHPRVRYPEGMEAYGVIVHRGTLTPLRRPYYHGIQLPDGKIFIRFVRAGPSASDAFQPGSEFLEWIDSINAKTEYVVFLVAPDSFETFHTAREELRRRKIACGWEPHEDGNGNALIDPSRASPGRPAPIQ